jgi:D-sedoheptulose 7-phosphate isomerase
MQNLYTSVLNLHSKSLNAKKLLFLNSDFLTETVESAHLLSERVRNGGRLIIAADTSCYHKASHLTEELLARYRKARSTVPAILIPQTTSPEKGIESFAKESDCVIFFCLDHDDKITTEVTNVCFKKNIPIIAAGTEQKVSRTACSLTIKDTEPLLRTSLLTLVLHLFCEPFEPEAPVLDDSFVKKYIQESIDAEESILVSEQYKNSLLTVCECIDTAVQKGSILTFFGNGGSAADAVEAVTLLQQCKKSSQQALPKALHLLDGSYLTCVINDMSFEEIFSRFIEGFDKDELTIVALTTSGNSKNILRAVKTAKIKGIQFIGISGKGGGLLKDEVPNTLIVESNSTNIVQEAHDVFLKAIYKHYSQ